MLHGLKTFILLSIIPMIIKISGKRNSMKFNEIGQDLKNNSKTLWPGL